MGIQLSWGDPEKTFILAEFSDPWTWTDYNSADTHGRWMLDSVDRPTDVIVDFTHSQRVPIGAIARFRQMAQNIHPNHGRFLFVKPNPMLVIIGNVMTKLFPQQAEQSAIFETRTEAIAFIYNQAQADSPL